MTDRLAATALRLLAPRLNPEGFGDHDSLQNVITDILPDGAYCFVTSNRVLYQLDKFSTLAPILGLIIAPLTGPGRWIAVLGSGLLSSGRMSVFKVNAGDDTIVITTTFEWEAMPTLGFGDYAPQLSGASFWTVESTTGVATYHGPSAIYHFVASVSLSNGEEDLAIQVQASLTKNGENLNTTNNQAVFTEDTTTALTAQFTSMTVTREIDVADGDTIQLIVRNVTPNNTDDIQMKALNIIGAPVN